jgi:hypothetical protein
VDVVAVTCVELLEIKGRDMWRFHCLSVCLPVCLSVFLSVCLSVCLKVPRYVCESVGVFCVSVYI